MLDHSLKSDLSSAVYKTAVRPVYAYPGAGESHQR